VAPLPSAAGKRSAQQKQAAIWAAIAAQQRAFERAQQAVFYVWPENVASFRLWNAVQTQWRVGGTGHRTGLDYASMRAKPAVRAVKPAQLREELLADIEAMEVAYLAERMRMLEAEAEKRKRNVG
jgi:hypothetical protein